MSDAPTTVWYATVDQSHNIVIGVGSIDVSETLNIDDLKKRILEKHNYRDVNPALAKIYRSSLNAAAEVDDEFQEKASALLNKRKPLAAAKKIRDCSIGELEILFVELPWRDVWYCLVDQSHEIVARVGSIDVSETLTIDDLKKRILEKHNYRDVNPALAKIYRSSLNAAAEVDDEFQEKVSALLNKSKPLAVAKKIRDCSIGEEEILFVKLPWRDVSYCLVDQSHKIVARVDSIDVSEALTINKLMEKVKEKCSYQVNPVLLNVYRSSFISTDEEEDDFQINVSSFLNESKPLRKLNTIQACNIGNKEILFVELPWRDVWYCVVDQSHKIIAEATRLRVSETLTIDELKKKILEEHSYRDVKPALTNLYRSSLNATDEEEEDFETNASTFLNESKPLRKFCNIGKNEILIVELPWIQPVDVWYRLVDHENNFKGTVGKVSATTISDLRQCVKNTWLNDLRQVDAESLVVWSHKPHFHTNTKPESIKNVNFNDDANVTKLEDDTPIGGLGLSNKDMLIVQFPGALSSQCFGIFVTTHTKMRT